MAKIVLIAGYGKDWGKSYLELAPDKFGSDWIEETMKRLGIRTALVAFWVDLDNEVEKSTLNLGSLYRVDLEPLRKKQFSLDRWMRR